MFIKRISVCVCACVCTLGNICCHQGKSQGETESQAGFPGL